MMSSQVKHLFGSDKRPKKRFSSAKSMALKSVEKPIKLDYSNEVANTLQNIT
jgi:hypothetical protein